MEQQSYKSEDQVIVRVPQLRGNVTEVKCGKVIASTVDRVSVQFPGEFQAHEFPIDKVSMAKGTFGEGANFDNPYEVPVQKLYRR
jgi:hypothetical protein